MKLDALIELLKAACDNMPFRFVGVTTTSDMAIALFASRSPQDEKIPVIEAKFWLDDLLHESDDSMRAKVRRTIDEVAALWREHRVAAHLHSPIPTGVHVDGDRVMVSCKLYVS